MPAKTFLLILRTLLLNPLSAHWSLRNKVSTLDTRSEFIVYAIVIALLARKR